MAITVEVSLERRFKTTCPYEIVFKTLADVPYSVSHFPKVEELEDWGDEVYFWKMEGIGIGKYQIQTSYACAYTNNKKEGWVQWAPIADEGNALVEGKWTIKELAHGVTQIDFTTDAELTLPLPRLIQAVLAPLVAREFEGLVDKYLENLKDTFSKAKPKKKAAAKKKSPAKKKATAKKKAAKKK